MDYQEPPEYQQFYKTLIEQIAAGHEEYRIWLHWFDEAPDFAHKAALCKAMSAWLYPRFIQQAFEKILGDLAADGTWDDLFGPKDG